MIGEILNDVKLCGGRNNKYNFTGRERFGGDLIWLVAMKLPSVCM
jgi:hypothetical protein